MPSPAQPSPPPSQAVTLPRTLVQLISPEGKAAIQQAEQQLNALTRLRLVIVDTSGKQHEGTIQIANTGEAVLRIQL